MSLPAVSIIIPVYNVERFLGECLDSVLVQTFGDFEAVCVNDGSTDRSPQILEAYAAADPRIRIINQENGGLSAARNAGLAHAQGKYVAFLDSDDLLTPDMLEKTVAKAEEMQADIVIFDYFVLEDDTGRLGHYRDQAIYADLDGSVFSLSQAPQMAQFIGVWDRLFRRDFLERYHFEYPVGRYYEDVTYCFQTELRANRIALIADHLYYYRRNVAGSITGGEYGSERHREDYLYVQGIAQQELAQAGATGAMMRYYADYYFERSYAHQRWIRGMSDFKSFFRQVRKQAYPSLTSASLRNDDARISFYRTCVERNAPFLAWLFMKTTNQIQRPYTYLRDVLKRRQLIQCGELDKDGKRLRYPERAPQQVPGWSREEVDRSAK